MLITLFAKKRTTKEGKLFYNYLSTLTTKDGEDIVCRIKFRDSCGSPKPESCPRNIIAKKEDMNYTRKEITNPETGEIVTTHTIWITAWEDGPEYKDTSMDIFED